ncbi:AAA family ATPase [Lentisphaera profundi]|uniref:AAA family ATPase n=1 Tax=Lentisphaera profundi TaxID=1658616 RepID=A0ABY7VZ51_9BACT|nr:AAA family ATPase [Lentisphaera profundi]WDE98543.1 AAA family ATPase [Lentisphaera profundi]
MKPFMHKKNCAFETDPTPSCFFESPQHAEAISRLQYICTDRGINIGVITGKIGSGKTLLCKTLGQMIDYSYKLVYIPSSNISFEAILDTIIFQLSGVHKTIELKMDRYLLLSEFEKIMHETIIATGRHLIIMLDECQMISVDCLRNLKCLTNSTQNSSGVSLILCGQPEFNQTLMQCPTVAQRVGLMYFLPYLEADQIESYIRFRMNKINKEVSIDQESVDMIYGFSLGCPREINKVCKIAFEHVDEQDAVHFSHDTISLVINDIQQQKLCLSMPSF